MQWDYTADLYLKPTKYSKILKKKLPSRVIFEMYAYTRIKFMWKIKNLEILGKYVYAYNPKGYF